LWTASLQSCNFPYFYATGTESYVFTWCDHKIYQLDSNGRYLNHWSTGGYTIVGMVANDTDIFAYLASSKTMHFRLNNKNTTLITMYQNLASFSNGRGDILINITSIQISNNKLFFTVPQKKDSSGCASSYSVFQFTPQISPNFTTFRSIPQKSFYYTNFMVKHTNISRTYGINSMTFTSASNRNKVDIPSNAYMGPVIIPTSSGSWNLTFFSGSGHLRTNLCMNNSVYFINLKLKDPGSEELIINNLQSSTVLSPTYSFCGFRTPSISQMTQFAAIYDYASILLSTDYNYVYLIHGGCACYSGTMTSSVKFLSIDQENNLSYSTGFSNNQIF
jgi:hypothetical protein